MATHYVYQNGRPVPDGVCVRPLAVKTLLTIEVESLERLSPSVIMDHLKKRWGCVAVLIETEVVTVKGQ